MILALWALPGVALEPVPTVEFEFVIDEDSELNEPLKRSDKREEVREKVRQGLLDDLLEAHFSFLKWRQAEPGGAAPIARLTVTLEDEKAGGMYNRKVLRFTGVSPGGGEVAITLEPELQVYDEWTHEDEPDQIRRDILEAVLKCEKPEELRKSLHEQFTSQIPLSRQVFGDREEKKVYVELDFGKLRASPDSQLRVELFRKEGDENPAGHLELTQLVARQGVESVQGIVSASNQWQLEQVGKDWWWHEEIPKGLEEFSKEVTMKAYEPDYDPDGRCRSPDCE